MFDPFLSVDYITEGLVPWIGGLKRVTTKRVTVGLTYYGNSNTYTVSTGFTLNVSDLAPVIFRYV